MHVLRVMGVVPDGKVNAQVQLEIAAASRDDQRAVERRRPDDFPVLLEHSLKVFEDRVTVIRGFGDGCVQVRGHHEGVRPLDSGETKPCQGCLLYTSDAADE